jgi:hypothetical protein
VCGGLEILFPEVFHPGNTPTNFVKNKGGRILKTNKKAPVGKTGLKTLWLHFSQEAEHSRSIC